MAHSLKAAWKIAPCVTRVYSLTRTYTPAVGTVSFQRVSPSPPPQQQQFFAFRVSKDDCTPQWHVDAFFCLLTRCYMALSVMNNYQTPRRARCQTFGDCPVTLSKYKSASRLRHNISTVCSRGDCCMHAFWFWKIARLMNLSWRTVWEWVVFVFLSHLESRVKASRVKTGFNYYTFIKLHFYKLFTLALIYIRIKIGKHDYLNS